ncbi:MAG: hypothetical protein ACFUZC_05075 [Chthoniobacteraceae bacterium]
MKLTPIKSYRDPAYPTNAILTQHPEFLRVLPRRWHNNALVLGSLAGIIALMEQSPALAEDKPAQRVAPIFVHGEGRAAFGGDGPFPPALLTEGEARVVIEEEAKKAGIDLTTRGYKLNNIKLPVTYNYTLSSAQRAQLVQVVKDVENENKTRMPGSSTITSTRAGDVLAEEDKKPLTTQGDLELDGWNEKLQIGYEFVSDEDFVAWQNKDLRSMSTVSTHDYLGTARTLQTGIGKTNTKAIVAVFYQPAANKKKAVIPPDLPKNYNELSEDGKKAAQAACHKEYLKGLTTAAEKATADELRNQVKDFLAWLKAQGVI